MRPAATISIIAGCSVLLVTAILVAIFGGAGAIYLWLGGSGSFRRAAAQSEMDKTLHVTVEHASRAGRTESSNPDVRPLTCRLRFENTSDKDISAFSGTILFTDQSGWTVFSCGVDDGRLLRARETLVDERMLDCIAHTPSSGTVDGIDIDTLTVTWLGRSLTLTDGTLIEVFPGP